MSKQISKKGLSLVLGLVIVLSTFMNFIIFHKVSAAESYLYPITTTSSKVVAVNPSGQIIMEAENGTLTSTTVSTSSSGYSGSGYVTDFTVPDSAVTITANAQSAGLYDVTIRYRASYGEKTLSFIVNNGSSNDIYLAETLNFTDVSAGRVQLNLGNNTFRILSNWGWYDIDYIKLTPASSQPTSQPTSQPSGSHKLTNANSTQITQNVYNYICDMYGSKMLSAQMESAWDNTEIAYVKSVSGKEPAIRGLDFINGDYDGVVKRATEWWNKGGIPTIMWHMGTPPNCDAGYESSKGTVNLEQIVTPGTTLYNQFIANIDKGAAALKELQDAGVPVIWRPFHEFDGGWFWWGKGGGDNFIKLWKIMYDRYTNHHKLNNLIWTLGYSGEVRNGWYPGDAYVDIAGADTYSTGTQNGLFKKVKTIVGNTMPVCYHECGSMPDPDAMLADGTRWSWFMVWHTSYIKQTNSADYIKKVYNHDFVITLDELPKFSNYSTPAPTSVVTPTPSAVKYGDLNNDGSANSIDFGLLRMVLIGGANENSVNMKAADIDGNGQVNSIDFAYFRQYLLGIINKLPPS